MENLNINQIKQIVSQENKTFALRVESYQRFYTREELIDKIENFLQSINIDLCGKIDIKNADINFWITELHIENHKNVD